MLRDAGAACNLWPFRSACQFYSKAIPSGRNCRQQFRPADGDSSAWRKPEQRYHGNAGTFEVGSKRRTHGLTPQISPFIVATTRLGNRHGTPQRRGQSQGMHAFNRLVLRKDTRSRGSKGANPYRRLVNRKTPPIDVATVLMASRRRSI